MGDAHSFLVGIGATRTARVVGDVRALFPRGFGAAFERTSLVKLDQHRDALERLSDHFCRLSENVPVLAMRYVNELTGRRRRR